MSKYSSQFKFNVVQDHLKLGGLKKLAKQYSINTSDIRNWTLTFQANGLSGLQKRSRQRYTPEFKIAVLKFMKLNLISARPAAAHFNIAAPSTITIWQRLYNEGGIAALQSKPRERSPMPTQSEIAALLARPSSELTHQELLRKAQYLAVENAYLKSSKP